jgi:hypothetical protein
MPMILRCLPALLLLVVSSNLAPFAEEMTLGGAFGVAAVSLTAGATNPVSSLLRRRRGRPRKFGAPARAVTVTLPESVIESLSQYNPDLSRAIVTVANNHAPATLREAAELAVFGRRAVITIRPTTTLEQRAGIDLVPLPDGRALISFDQPKSVAELELLLGDAIDDPKLAPEDRKIFEGIRRILKDARQSKDVSLLRRTIIVLESNGQRKPRRPPRTSRAKA